MYAARIQKNCYWAYVIDTDIWMDISLISVIHYISTECYMPEIYREQITKLCYQYSSEPCVYVAFVRLLPNSSLKQTIQIMSPQRPGLFLPFCTILNSVHSLLFIMHAILDVGYSSSYCTTLFHMCNTVLCMCI